MHTQTETDPTIAHLLRWLEQGGAQSTKMHVVSLGAGERGIFAREDIAPGELLLRIPRTHVMSAEDVRSSDLGRAIDAHGRIEYSTHLAAFILQEKARGEASFWKPFLDSLPKSFPTYPFFFDERELSLLKGSSALQMLENQRQALAFRHAQLREQVPGFARFSLEEFAQAHFIVHSRSFGLTLPDGTRSECLTPLADMINDHTPWNTQWGWSEDGTHFELKALGVVGSGQELLTTYGDKSNLRLLLNYGYAHDDSARDEVTLSLELPREVPLAAEKQRLLGLTDASEPRTWWLPRQFDVARMGELFSFLRIAYAEAEDLTQLESSPNARMRAMVPLSKSNEQRAIQAFLSTCEARLAGYETSVEEDDRLLQEETLSLNARNCIVVRRGEKRLLQWYIRIYNGFAQAMNG